MKPTLFRRYSKPGSTVASLFLIASSLMACVGVDTQTLDASDATTNNLEQSAQQTSTQGEINNSAKQQSESAAQSNHRPRHLPPIIEPGTPWWAVAARWESGDASIDDVTENLSTQISPTALENTPAEVAEVIAPQQPNDIWQRIRNGFQLNGQDHRFVQPYIGWYAKHQAYLDRVAERARPFLYDIVQEVEARGMPMEIVLLPVVESAFQPFAYSPGRAAGIWQFIPATGKHYGLKQNWWYDGRRDVPKATKAALDYLERLAKRFDGDWLLALASYNSGEGRVSRAVKKNKKKGRPTDFWSLDLPKETEAMCRNCSLSAPSFCTAQNTALPSPAFPTSPISSASTSVRRLI